MHTTTTTTTIGEVDVDVDTMLAEGVRHAINEADTEVIQTEDDLARAFAAIGRPQNADEVDVSDYAIGEKVARKIAEAIEAGTDQLDPDDRIDIVAGLVDELRIVLREWRRQAETDWAEAMA